jgi:hypothetical protein
MYPSSLDAHPRQPERSPTDPEVQISNSQTFPAAEGECSRSRACPRCDVPAVEATSRRQRESVADETAGGLFNHLTFPFVSSFKCFFLPPCFLWKPFENWGSAPDPAPAGGFFFFFFFFPWERERGEKKKREGEGEKKERRRGRREGRRREEVEKEKREGKPVTRARPRSPIWGSR